MRMLPKQHAAEEKPGEPADELVNFLA